LFFVDTIQNLKVPPQKLRPLRAGVILQSFSEPMAVMLGFGSSFEIAKAIDLFGF
jgi:hypothetical protein